MLKTMTVRTTIAAILAGLSMSAHAIADTARPFSVPAGDLVAALESLSKQADIELVYQAEQLRGIHTAGVNGTYEPKEAVTLLLKGTRLTIRTDDATGVMLVAPPTAPKTSSPAAPAAPSGKDKDADGESFWSRLRIAQTNTASPSQGEGRSESGGSEPARESTREVEVIIVTGSNIRGGVTASPVTTISTERIQQEGLTDLGEVVRSVPQNFSGGQNPGVLMGNVIGAGLANQNVTGGSALNLRGLGPDASLTLLNGRRMAYSGFAQAVDISAIPMEAVDRIDILTDGASAIYGSDAVGGVANVILQRNFNGLALGGRYGAATDGGLATREYTVTAGTTWSTGGILAAYKDESADPVYARQRDYSAHLRDPQMLLPNSGLRSGLISAHQSVSDAIELRVDALRSKRRMLFDFYGSSASFYNILRPETTTSLISPGIEIALPKSWRMSLSAALGKDDYIENQTRFTFATGAITPQVLGCYCNKSRTYELGAEGPVFAMPAGEARLAVGAGYRKNELELPGYLDPSGAGTPGGEESSRFAYTEINLPLVNSTAAGGQRLDLTAAARAEDYDSFGKVSTPKIGLIYSPGTDFTLKASWGKSFKAPTLLQMLQPQGMYILGVTSLGGVGYPAGSVALYEFGGSPSLTPERAKVWTASTEFHPVAMPGLQAELTWFDIDYTDRVVQPITAFAQALTNPAFAEFVEYSPSTEQQAAAIASTQHVLNLLGVPYDPNRVVALVQGRYINADRQKVSGLDLSGSYRFELAPCANVT